MNLIPSQSAWQASCTKKDIGNCINETVRITAAILRVCIKHQCRECQCDDMSGE